jgi:hypothetical protein
VQVRDSLTPIYFLINIHFSSNFYIYLVMTIALK